MMKPAIGTGVLAALMLTITAQAQPVTPYKTPDLTADIFGGETTLPENDKKAVATCLAQLVRNTLKFEDKADYAKASKLLGVALRLDGKNRAAIVVNANLEQGQPPDTDANFVRDDAIKVIRRAARTSAESKKKPDVALAAYLYGAINTVARNDDDTFELEMLKKDGHVPDWAFAEGKASKPAANADNKVAAAGAKKNLEKIQGMVVLGSEEARMYGKVVEIIATKPPEERPGARQIRVIGRVGEQMRISFDEALRVVRQRNAKGAGELNVEISFSDKYSPKDGGSAGCAFTLLLLSMMGDIDLASDFAITGDVTIDNKVRQVGGVYTKVAGAAKDGAKVVIVPASNASAMGDAFLLEGAAPLWAAQVFSAETIDDAIAVAKAKRDEKLAEAMKLFDELRTSHGKKPVYQLNADKDAKEKLAKIRELAPNHLSAMYLQLASTGKAPKTLTINASITEALNAIGPMRNGINDWPKADYGQAANLAAAKRDLTKIDAIVDPSVKPFTRALAEFCVAYADYGAAEASHDIRHKFNTRDVLKGKIGGVRSALERISSDKDAMSKILRGE